MLTGIKTIVAKGLVKAVEKSNKVNAGDLMVQDTVDWTVRVVKEAIDLLF